MLGFGISPPMTSNDVDIMARTIYGEARGEYGGKGGLAALIAVGNVVMNRVQAGCWYGKTIEEVCLKPWQFSCWNEEDRNRALIMRLIIEDPLFTLCQEVATKLAAGEWPDLTKGSDHYHATTMISFPKWTKERKAKICLGNHLFYRLTKGE